MTTNLYGLQKYQAGYSGLGMFKIIQHINRAGVCSFDCAAVTPERLIEIVKLIFTLFKRN